MLSRSTFPKIVPPLKCCPTLSRVRRNSPLCRFVVRRIVLPLKLNKSSLRLRPPVVVRVGSIRPVVKASCCIKRPSLATCLHKLVVVRINSPDEEEKSFRPKSLRVRRGISCLQWLTPIIFWQSSLVPKPLTLHFIASITRLAISVPSISLSVSVLVTLCSIKSVLVDLHV